MRRALLLLLLCIPAFFVFLGSVPITDSDEAYYAEAAREMMESGDWITPRFNYQLRFEKPILFYWMIAATYAVAGVGEAAARLWAAMAGVGLVMVAYASGRRWMDEDTGLFAGAITATSFAASSMARQSLPDLPLAFFITLAVWAGFEAFARGDLPGAARPRSGATSRRWLVISAVSTVLAMLTKGPVGVALPVMIIVGAVALDYFFHPSRRLPPVRASDLALAVLAFVAVAVPWYAAVTWVHGPGYLHRFFIAENFDRFATARYNDPRPIWFYVPILIGGLLPWSVFALLWVRRPAGGFKRWLRDSPQTARLVLWAIVPLAVFSVSVGKQPRYILPCLVPLALLLGSSIAQRVRTPSGARRDRRLTMAGLISGGVLLAVGVLLYRASPLIRAAGGDGTGVWSGLVIAAAVFVLAASLAGSARAVPWSVAVASAATLLALHGSIAAMAQAEPVVAAAEMIGSQRSDDTEVCACGAFLRNLPFYVGTRTIPAGTQEEVNAVLARPEGLLAAIDERKLVEAESVSGRRVERLAEMPYLNTALLRIDDFLHPDPQRALQRIVVIRTR